MVKVGSITRFIRNRMYSTKTYTNVDASIKKYASVFGKSAGEYLGDQIRIVSNDKNELILKNKKIAMDLANSILYPINGLPIDLLESVLLYAKKVNPKSRKINNLLNTNLIKNRQKARSLTSKNSAVINCLDSMSLTEDALFKLGQNRLNPVISNYSSDKERAVNRLASGMVPAVFFATDAYNQSMMINNKKDEAKSEYKKRFKQEVTRIGIMAYAQFVVLGALSKYVNKSALASIATSTTIVAGTEMLSRLFAGKHITFIKNRKKDEEHPIVDIANDDSSIKHTSKILKYTTGFFVAGGVMAGLQATKTGKTLSKSIAKKYDNLIHKDIYINKEEFNSLMQKLNKNGFDKMAQRYEQIASKNNSDKIYLGRENRKILAPILDSIIMTPIKMAYNIATMPFKVLFNNKNKVVVNNINENELQGLNYIRTIKNKKNFKKQLNDKILQSFDNKTKTNYSNHNLAKYSKVTTSAASTYFIVADSYNMVIEKENNKENAKKVSKKVLSQRIANIGLGAYILTVLNNIFKMQYNKSLYGVAFVAGAFGLINESLSRLVTGIPITKKNKDEQVKFKQKYNKLLNKTTT